MRTHFYTQNISLYTDVSLWQIILLKFLFRQVKFQKEFGKEFPIKFYFES